ncbi:hypothetical protein CLAIMM_14714 [Cladophialophora immunda]|nr:hypothetical protein CLAIMM_14714 [Cladophialophora immunda]
MAAKMSYALQKAGLLATALDARGSLLGVSRPDLLSFRRSLPTDRRLNSLQRSLSPAVSLQHALTELDDATEDYNVAGATLLHIARLICREEEKALDNIRRRKNADDFNPKVDLVFGAAPVRGVVGRVKYLYQLSRDAQLSPPPAIRDLPGKQQHTQEPSRF